jgi:hypothetical protein
LKFQIDPAPGETQRGCSAVVQASLPPNQASLILIALYVAVFVAAFFLTPTTRITTAVIGVAAIVASTGALQSYGRSRLRRLRESDPHSLETHFVELTPAGLHTWCAHVDARYSWQEFTKVTENREFYLFVRGSGSGAAIPKRLLNEVLDTELRDHIRDWSVDHGASLAREAHTAPESAS